MTEPSNDPGVEHEPHFRSQPPHDQHADDSLPEAPARLVPDIDHTVWDEPALSSELAGTPDEQDLTWSSWLAERTGQISWTRSWVVTLVVSISAGPWAVLGAMLMSRQTFATIMVIALFGPAVEEIMKVAGALWVVEKKPWLFRSWIQIAFCGLAGGLAFAVLENLLYIHVYLTDPSAALIRWRWTVCVALHMGCSLIASLGLIRVWRRTLTQKSRPELSRGAPCLVLAMVVHGVYNAGVVLLELSGFEF